jgi:toxin ParE1/3/4
LKVIYAPEAANDADQIERYHADRTGADFAIRFIDHITDTFERLVKRHPAAGRARPDLGPERRCLSVIPYVVFYRIEGRTVYVIRILHGRRDIKPPLASLLLAM